MRACPPASSQGCLHPTARSVVAEAACALPFAFRFLFFELPP
jgi:hypothetical protein